MEASAPSSVSFGRASWARPVVFRPSLLVRVPVAAASVVWAAIFLAAIVLDGVPAAQTFAALAFSLSLGAAAVHYGSLSIRVDDYGIVYSALGTTRVCSWEDIQQIRADVLWPLRGYTVCTHLEAFAFSSFFGRHGELFSLIRERARLGEPLR